MKEVNPHRDCLEPFFDVVPLAIVELTAQIVSKEGSQVVSSIHQKLRLRNAVFLGQTVEKRRPQKSQISDVQTRAWVVSTMFEVSEGVFDTDGNKSSDRSSERFVGRSTWQGD